MDKDDDARVSLAKDAPAGDSAAVSTGPDAAAGTPEAGPGRPAEGPLGAFVSGAAYGALGLLGAAVGLLGSFVQDWTAGDVPVAAVLGVPVVFAMVRLAGWGMGGRLGATVPAVVWGVVVFVMSMRRPEGDLVVPATLAGYVYIIGGMAAAVLAVARVPAAGPSGQWLLGRAARTRG